MSNRRRVRYVALLRGINVGGRRKVPMAALRSLIESLGGTDVATYLQSGNAVFGTDDDDADVVASRLEHALADEFGFDVDVLVRSAAEVASVVDANPFARQATADPKSVHAVFLGQPPDQAGIDAVDASRFAPEELVVGDRVLYLYTPGGIGNSKLAAALTQKRLGTVSTARNWRTVLALAELADG